MLLKLGAEYSVAFSAAPFATSAMLCILSRIGMIDLGKINPYITTEVCIGVTIFAIVIYLLDIIPIPVIGDGIKVVIEKLKSGAAIIISVALAFGLFTITTMNSDVASAENTDISVVILVGNVLYTMLRAVLSAIVVVNVMLLRFTIDTVSTILGTLRFTGLSLVLETINTIFALGMAFISIYAPWLAIIINLIIIIINLLVIKKIIRLHNFTQTMIVRPLWINFINRCFKKDYSVVKLSKRDLKMLKKYDIASATDVRDVDIRPMFINKKYKKFKFNKLDKALYINDKDILLIKNNLYDITERRPNTSKYKFIQKMFKNRQSIRIEDAFLKVIYNEKLSTLKK